MKTLAERFWPKVEKTETCWIWRGAATERGYGLIDYGGRSNKQRITAHRAAVIIQTGDLNKKTVVRHECNNKLCVRVMPGHVQVGTQKDNMRDRELAGNTLRGSRHGKLSLQEASDMIKLWNIGDWSTRELAVMFGVGKSTVFSLVSGQTAYATEVGIVPIKRSRSEATSGRHNGRYKHGEYVQPLERVEL